MGKSKVFIACSSKALKLAQCLKSALGTEYCETTVWNRIVGLSKLIIEKLEQSAKDSDFAVVILTRDDAVQKDGGESKWQARDNCIYEAGLFAGALGRDRCFLMVSEMLDTMPADLNGVTYAPFFEPKDLNNVEECKQAVEEASLDILQSVQTLKERPKGLLFEQISPKDLLEREKHVREKGGQLADECWMVVSAREPFEESYNFLGQVARNLEDGITYFYFFHASNDGAQKICRILQTVLLASVLKESPAIVNAPFKDRCDAAAKYQDEILIKLEEIRKDDTLRFCFLPEDPALEFCIHNATSKEISKVYLKKENSFIKMLEGPEASQLCRYLSSWFAGQPPGIFQSTKLCDITKFAPDGKPFYNSLDDALRKHFPNFSGKIMDLCYPARSEHVRG